METTEGNNPHPNNGTPARGGQAAPGETTRCMSPEQQARATRNRERALARKKSTSVETFAAVHTPEDSARREIPFANPYCKTIENVSPSLTPKKLFVANPYLKRVDPYHRKSPAPSPVKKKKLYPVFCVDSVAKKGKMVDGKVSEFDDEGWERAAMKHMDEYEKIKNNKVKTVSPGRKEVSGLTVISIGHRYNCNGVKVEKFKCEIGVKGLEMNINLDGDVKNFSPRLKCDCGVSNCDCDSS